MEISDKSILLTGASSGIGRETAIALAAKGANLILGGRNEQALKATRREVREAGGEAFLALGDVTDPEWRDRAIKEAMDRYGQLNVLINNAGVVAAGRLERVDAEVIEQQLLTNLNASVLLTRSALPAIRRSGGGAIVNVSSVFGLVGMSFYATYSATKAGLARFGEALRRELDGEGISVLNIYPTATDTPMMETTELGPDQGFHYEKPEEVAQALVDALEADRNEEIRGGQATRDMVQTNLNTPEAIDEQFRPMKETLERATANHRRL